MIIFENHIARDAPKGSPIPAGARGTATTADRSLLRRKLRKLCGEQESSITLVTKSRLAQSEAKPVSKKTTTTTQRHHYY